MSRTLEQRRGAGSSRPDGDAIRTRKLLKGVSKRRLKNDQGSGFDTAGTVAGRAIRDRAITGEWVGNLCMVTGRILFNGDCSLTRFKRHRLLCAANDDFILIAVIRDNVEPVRSPQSSRDVFLIAAQLMWATMRAMPCRDCVL